MHKIILTGVSKKEVWTFLYHSMPLQTFASQAGLRWSSGGPLFFIWIKAPHWNCIWYGLFLFKDETALYFHRYVNQGPNNFLPLLGIFKGTYSKLEFVDGMPVGSGAIKNKPLSYVCAQPCLWREWTKTLLHGKLKIKYCSYQMDKHLITRHCKCWNLQETMAPCFLVTSSH